MRFEPEIFRNSEPMAKVQNYFHGFGITDFYINNCNCSVSKILSTMLSEEEKKKHPNEPFCLCLLKYSIIKMETPNWMYVRRIDKVHENL